MDRLSEYVKRQREWSRVAFGLGRRTKGICEHIRKELKEIEEAPDDVREWIDVAILALDGYWRAGGDPDELMALLVEKQEKNLRRRWGPVVSEDLAVEHDRTLDVDT